MRRLLILLICVFAGCGVPKTSPPAKVPAKAEPWTVGTIDSGNPVPAYLSNGLIGLRQGRSGTALDTGDEPLPMFDADEYETSGEERIRALPNPLKFEWPDGSPMFDASSEQHYHQKLDFRTSLLESSWEGSNSEFGKYTVHSEVVLHPTKRMLGIRLTLVASRTRGERGLRLAFKGVSSARGNNQRGRAHRLIDGGSEFSVVERYLPVARASALEIPDATIRIQEVVFSLGRSPNAINVADEGRPDFGKPELTLSFDEIALQSRDYWSGSSAPDIEIDGPVEDQQAIRSFLYYLRSSIHPGGGMPVSPFGLSNALYNGHVFWDADLWVFPALAFVDPARAKCIADYRISRADAARNSFDQWMSDGRPTATGKLGLMPSAGEEFAMKFPWESGVTGKETAFGQTRFQDHLSGDVAFALDRAAALGLADVEKVKAVQRGIRGFYDHRFEGGGSSSYRTIPDTMAPDELYVGDNDLYTNVIAQWIFSGCRFDSEDALIHFFEMYLPRDSTTFLAYEGDPIRTYQQTTALLTVYPLQFPPAEREARKMLGRFEPKVSKNGPAMSESIHALIWARLGEKERAYQTWRTSWQDFTNHPLLLFSEKRTGNQTYFVTGAAGCLQTVIYGFLGFRIDDKPQPGAAWSTPLKNGKVLSIKPNLPPAWKKATFRNFSVLGKRYTLTVTQNGAKVPPFQK